ncbi:MAG: hypothetical protein A2051_07720 [Desulfovibrionales bacterium GWA2_65_9]|nr:MAG: hypothetical protein A2051_07720 [Desulfovibrionales bacterium GWA2_65_9]
MPSMQQNENARRDNGVLLISLTSSLDNIGVKYLHSALLANNIQSTVLFFPADDVDEYTEPMKNFVKAGDFIMVGISLMSIAFEKAVKITRIIKSHSSVPVVWGGIHPTIDPDSARTHADYFCVGEAEASLVEFVNRLKEGGEGPVLDVKGLNHSSQEGYTIAPSITNLDTLAFPHHHPPYAYVSDAKQILPLDTRLFRKHARYHGSQLTVISSRGCPFKCSFCCNDLLKDTFGSKVRRRSPENVMRELEANYYTSPVHINYVDFYDDCLISHPDKWIERFVNLYKKINVPLMFHAIPSFITEHKMALLSSIPGGFALVGLQSGSEKTNALVYKRKQTRETFIKAIEIIQRHGACGSYDIITENPYETEEDWHKTIGLVSKLPRNTFITLYSLTFYKNTELYRMALRDGLNVETHKTKSQGKVAHKSREVRAIRVGFIFGEAIAVNLLQRGDVVGNAALAVLAFVCQYFIDPIRYIRLGYISQGRNIPRFTKLLFSFSSHFLRNYVLAFSARK